MKGSGCRVLGALLAVAGLGMSCQARASKNGEDHTAGKIYPQLVHISYVQGDVRISRGDDRHKVSKTDWGAAVAGLPVQTGYYIATGADGRAEIEFEDASVVYLAENSVLEFDDIHSTDDVPFTSLSLLAGTMSMDVNDFGGAFEVETPTGSVVAAKDKPSYMRLTSYLDAMAISVRGDQNVLLPEANGHVSLQTNGTTIYYKGGKRVTPPADAVDATRMAAWDEWVDQRVKQRATEMAAVMKESGIQRPLPGLEAFYNKGKFFQCGSYGTCWVPSKKAADTEEPIAMSSSRYGGPADPMLGGEGQYPIGLLGPASYLGFGFPCDPYWMWDASVDPMDWDLCGYGNWIPYNDGYAWVAPSPSAQGGPRHIRYPIHHNPPVRWVRYGGKTAFVPRNPRDIDGKPPLNASHGIFTMHGRNVQRLTYNPREPLREMRGEPGRYLKPVNMRLTRTEAPKPVVRDLGMHAQPVVGRRGVQHAHLLFDRSTQSFLLNRPVSSHGRTTMRVESFMGPAGRLQARAEGLDGRGNYHTAMSFGGSPLGRIDSRGVIHGGYYGWASAWNMSNGPARAFGGGGGYVGGMSGGAMPAASGGPVAASGGARR